MPSTTMKGWTPNDHPNRAEANRKHGKLTQEQVAAIRASMDTGANLAREYKVSTVTIWKIRHDRMWRLYL